jgi:hypothetical protein
MRVTVMLHRSPRPRQLLVLEEGPDLFAEAGFVALEPGLVGLVKGLDLLPPEMVGDSIVRRQVWKYEPLATF